MKWTTWSIAALAMAACTLGGREQLSPAFDESRFVTLSVANRHWQDVRVYLQPAPGSSPVRLGIVPSLTTRLLTIRTPPLSGKVRLLIRPVASRADSMLTEPILFGPGDMVRLTIENQLGLTNWSVAPRGSRQ